MARWSLQWMPHIADYVPSGGKSQCPVESRYEWLARGVARNEQSFIDYSSSVQCDGQTPCKRCEDAGEGCAYDRTKSESKEDLRAEINRLRKCSEETNRLMLAILSVNDGNARNAFIQELVEGSKSRLAILQELVHMDSENGRRPREGMAQVSNAGPSAPNSEVAVCPHCRSRLPSPMIHRSASGLSDFGSLAEAPERAFTSASATPIILSPMPFDNISHSQTDRWTRAGLTVASVRHLFGALLTWDYFPFCLMCKNPFLRDFYNGSNHYCSSSLVNALIALAIRVVNETNKEAERPGPGWSGSEAFFAEAEAIIDSTESSTNLPDIQALGVLSLYHIYCGRETEAHELAEAFAAHIANFHLQEPLMGVEAEEYAKVLATSYCGAVSLIRMLRLTTSQVCNLSMNHILQDDLVLLDQSSCRNEFLYGGQCGSGATQDIALDGSTSQLRNVEPIPARLFQLTEWVYKYLSTTHLPNGQLDSSEAIAVYAKCLDWYERLFPMLKMDGSDTPFVLFIHMYYQFCLICLLRPFTHLVVADSGIRPHDICLQAAESIIALSQSYSRIFTLRRVSALHPYFVCTAGLAGLAMGPTCNNVALAVARPISSREPSLTRKADAEVDGFNTYQQGSSAPSAGKISIVAQTSQLLAEMSANHRVASTVERMLRSDPKEGD
ncbi:hypothetical protein HIM_11160 [Hirsutella minnesotensis 3608]|uniref:Xylanolytic transcriptional activator regulatory domain-containing protein n=1 Tax=Hirsutella minnesotensis 3608 TaxID=1043627 RepID=A0A0F7ZJA4_9HYPO|nr:hypothetical protein HIM_11160 [Hirsutella minnesotensis 3608]